MIPAAERIIRARKMIQRARDLPPATDEDLLGLSYVAGVKDLLRQARDLVKFIPYAPTTTPELKDEVTRINQEADLAENELLHKRRQ
jgi:hypothetical protein